MYIHIHIYIENSINLLKKYNLLKKDYNLTEYRVYNK